jgi:hypothetical protein
MSIVEIGLSRDYAAALATVVNKRVSRPLGTEEYPQKSVFAGYSHRSYVSTNLPEKENLSES